MPILTLLCLCGISGICLLGRASAPRGDLNFWLYAGSHAHAYRSILPQFTKQTGTTVRIDLIPQQALNTRMVSLFMSGRTQGDLPDVVELEIADVGKYLRPATDEVGLLPLNEYLENSGFREIPDTSAAGRPGDVARCRADGRIYTYRNGNWVFTPDRVRPDAWIDRVVRSRFAPWSKKGIIFGVPNDVHPVTLSYRKDLWDEAGVDPEWTTDPGGQRRRTSWPEFQERCLQFQDYWAARGVKNRHAMELFESQPDMLVCLLLQRHINVIDADGNLHLTDRKTVNTLACYAQMVAGPRRIAAESANGAGPWANDVIQGNICAFLTPDWKLNDLRQYATSVAGNLRMMPLPRFDPDDAPTSTWGGTMIGIPRNSRHPQEAWKLIEFLNFSRIGLEARARETNNLPPLRDFWSEPFLHAPDAFYGGQRAYEMYIELADQIPPRYETWASTLGRYGLGYVLNQATGYLKRSGDPAGLEDFVSAKLQRVDAYVRRCIEHGTFESQ